MGSSGSKGAEQGGHGSGWQPGVPGQARRYSKLGYDITPLTTEERIAAAKPLSDFQRHVTLQVGACLMCGCAMVNCLTCLPALPVPSSGSKSALAAAIACHLLACPPVLPFAGGHGACIHWEDSGWQPTRQQAQGHLRQRRGRPAAVQLRWAGTLLLLGWVGGEVLLLS